MAKPANKKRSTANPQTPEWPFIYYLFAASAIALIVFAQALNGGFIFDDYHLPFADPNAARMPAAFWVGGARPVLMATYWANFLIAGTHPLLYHLTNVVLHAACGVLVFFIYTRVLGIAGFEKRDARGMALFGACLFLVHPLQTEPVNYIAGRSEIVSGFLYFAAWLVFLRHFEKETSLLLALKICILAGLAVMAKESAISLPAILLLTDFYFSKEPMAKQLAHRFNLYGLFLAGGLVAVALILRSLTGETAAGFATGIRPFDYALTQCRAILTYVRLFMLPVGQNGDWQMPFYHSVADGAAGAFAAGLAGLLALTVWLYSRARLISYGLAVFLLMLAPTSSFVPIKDALAERRMYLPVTGLILALAGVVYKIRWTHGWRRACAIGVLLVCAGLSWQRSAAWASDFNLWSDSIRKNPDNARAHFGLGTAMMISRDCAGAAREFSAARAAGKHTLEEVSDSEVTWNLAMAYECDKKPTDALAQYRAFAAAQPTAAVYDRIGFLEAKGGDTSAALGAFEKAMQLDASDANAYAYRGMVFLAGENYAAAQADLKRAMEIDPENQVAAEGMAKLTAGR
jgi:protein O-mannosyl-transferase